MLSGDGADFLGIVTVAGGIFAVWERGSQQTFYNYTCSGHGCPLDMSISSVGPLLDSRLLRAKPQQWMWVIFRARPRKSIHIQGGGLARSIEVLLASSGPAQDSPPENGASIGGSGPLGRG
jgi:hypothetical protein